MQTLLMKVCGLTILFQRPVFLVLLVLISMSAPAGLADVAAQAEGMALPSGFTQHLVVSGLNMPTSMAFAPDGRIFVTQQGGVVRVIQNGTLLSTPFISLSVSSSGERGLLGLAFDPNFNTNHYVYVYYTVPSSPPHNRISRFTANGNTGNSQLNLFELDNLSASNHNGGSLHFGPDGKLYVAVGENANGANAQSTNNLLGKMLRLNADGSVPTDNPFYNNPNYSGKNRAIWALGLRNPYMFAFQPGTGRMFINDVGEQTWEEIDDGIAGSNYGWPTTEGVTSNPAFRSPLYAYNHSNNACAITGGTFYNPVTRPFPADYVGDYFFADYCADWIRRYDVATDTAQTFASSTPGAIVDLDVDDSGSLYFLARQSGGTNGALYRISYACPTPISLPNAAPIRNQFTTSQPTLTWSPLNWAKNYQVEVDNNPAFRDIDYSNDQIPQGTLSVTTADLVNCVYYWRVRGQQANGSWGGWSKAEPFVVDAP